MYHQVDYSVVRQSVQRGLSAFGVPEPMTLTQWAEEHFYLSAESSYVEQRWSAWPFQRAIMACISNDDIREVDWKKSARVGYTKIILAALGYFAQHKRRNQALWQPTDDDRDEFVKTELDTMLRDVEIMRTVFPAYLSRHKDNTLLQKKFLGSLLYLRGGKAAKNYRRISVDVAFLDEISAFDPDIEKEGDAHTLASKRVEGATFPKMVDGSTPKLRGFCQIDARYQQAQVRYAYHINCPHCEGHHALTWGGKDEPHGFKWVGDDPQTVRHLCPHCGVLITQAEYQAVWESGFWCGDDGSTIDHQGVFRDAAGEIISPPSHVAFHIWTAYSPRPAWSEIVRDFQAAYAKAQEGDDAKLKTFWNTTLGETWEGEIERTEAQELQQRAENFPLRVVPRGALLLLAGVDTQDNRLEVGVWAMGRGGEMWTIDHQIFFGNPALDEVWDQLAAFLFQTEYPNEVGPLMRIFATAIDSGGHHSHAVYEFARKHAGRRVFAVRGRPAGEKAIKDGAAAVDIDWNGKRTKKGVLLWHVGTNLAKDLLYGRMQVPTQGPGYVHFSAEFSLAWFQQFAGEVRATRRTLAGSQSRWTPMRKRVETWDCAVYVIWLEHHLELPRKSTAWWDALEEKVQPSQYELFGAPVAVAPQQQVARAEPVAPVNAPARIPTPKPASPAVATATRLARRASHSTYLARRR